MNEDHKQINNVSAELLEANKADNLQTTTTLPIHSAIKVAKSSKKGVLISEKVENCNNLY